MDSTADGGPLHPFLFIWLAATILACVGCISLYMPRSELQTKQEPSPKELEEALKVICAAGHAAYEKREEALAKDVVRQEVLQGQPEQPPVAELGSPVQLKSEGTPASAAEINRSIQFEEPRPSPSIRDRRPFSYPLPSMRSNDSFSRALADLSGDVGSTPSTRAHTTPASRASVSITTEKHLFTPQLAPRATWNGLEGSTFLSTDKHAHNETILGGLSARGRRALREGFEQRT